MIPRDIGDVPTLNSLNKPQKRALILRDQLRYLEPAHLDSYLNGVTADEPPTYKHVNGAVHPQLVQVTIKDDATRFDLGNVQFPEEGGNTYRTYLTVEDERFEMRTEEPLPRDDAELASVSIHRFVAENMFPLFKTKYKAIHARMEKINEARRVAYNMLSHPSAKFEDGETVARLKPAKSNAIEEASRDGSSRKRKEIVKHASNKRQRVGLETIPDTVKSEIFNTIPMQIKVDLFNSVIRTALPNFDNLIIASWNVVSVYANVGSDFPELHKAVVELKGALEEFESAYAPSRTKPGKSKKGSTPASQNGSNISRTSSPLKEGRATPVATARSNDVTANPAQNNRCATDRKYEEDDDHAQHQMPLSRSLEPSHQRKEIIKEVQRQSEPSTPTQSDRVISRAQPISRHAPESNLSSPRSSGGSASSSPNEQYLLPPRERARKIRDRSADPSPCEHIQAPGSELMRKRQEYMASLLKANRSSTGAALNHHSQRSEADEQHENVYDYDHDHAYGRRRSGSLNGHGQVSEGSLGNSMLGVKKKMGSAPVAPMVHTRKDGAANGGNSAGVRKH